MVDSQKNSHAKEGKITPKNDKKGEEVFICTVPWSNVCDSFKITNGPARVSSHPAFTGAEFVKSGPNFSKYPYDAFRGGAGQCGTTIGKSRFWLSNKGKVPSNETS
jgi:hypothetical protein